MTAITPTRVRVALPYLSCADCNIQLVHHVYVVKATRKLICLHCIRRHPAADLASVSMDAMGSVGIETMPMDAAIALLVEHGATLED